MGSRVNTVKREGFHSVHARVSKSKLALSSGVLEGLGQVGARVAVEARESEERLELAYAALDLTSTRATARALAILA